jgi:hypothetical protein
VADPAAILNAFAHDGWKSEPFERTLDLARADPTDAFRLLHLAIQRGGDSATFMDAAVSFVPEDLLADLANRAANAFLRDSDNEVAESVIAYLALQAVNSLQPFLLKFFFDATPNASTYYAEWPWRGAFDADIMRLFSSLKSATSPEERLRPFRCILESRSRKHISEALAAVGLGNLPYDESAYLAQVGFDGSQRSLLFNETVFHIRFPMDVLSYRSRPVWLQPSNHPTWSLPANPGRHRFGGLAESACAVCDGPLHNLITFEPTPDGIAFARPGRLQIATCLSCLGWSKAPLFFQHDDAGRPVPLDSGHQDPEFPTCPLQETWVELSPTPPRWRWQDWALSNSRENLHRVGGHPTWIQSAEYPTCPSCRRLMPMLLQLDSDLPTQEGGEWLWGSGGICYVFWCGNCSVSASLWQCT